LAINEARHTGIMCSLKYKDSILDFRYIIVVLVGSDDPSFRQNEVPKIPNYE